MEVLLVSIGGSLGAVLRYSVGQTLSNTSFPWATLAVNTFGSFALGILLFGSIDPDVLLLGNVGFCGAFTTFSSFSYQAVSLWERGEQARAVLHALGNLFLCLFAFGFAWIFVA